MVVSVGGIRCMYDPCVIYELWCPVAIFCLGISLWILIEFHAVGVNRRLDALVGVAGADKNEDGPDA